MSDVDLNGNIILVTGAAGFLGAALCRRLLEDIKNVVIVGIDNMDDYYDVSLKEARLAGLAKYPSFTFLRGDIVDREFITSVFREYTPRHVIHLAAQAGVRYSITNPDVYIESNLVGFCRILEGCRSYPVEHLIYASSSSVYGGNQKVPFAVQDRTDTPVSLYAATKKSNELMAYVYSNLYQIPCTGLRFFTVYGPGGRPDMAYFSFANQLLAGGKIRMFNYGDCQRDFTYIDDIIEGIVRVMHCPPEKSVNEHGQIIPPSALYNIGCGTPIHLLEFVEILEQELVRANLLPEDFDLAEHMELAPMQAGDVQVTFADTTAFAKKFGFQPSTPLREGLRKFAEWYKRFYMPQENS